LSPKIFEQVLKRGKTLRRLLNTFKEVAGSLGWGILQKAYHIFYL
jgi:hypothetical protein